MSITSVKSRSKKNLNDEITGCLGRLTLFLDGRRNSASTLVYQICVDSDKYDVQHIHPGIIVRVRNGAEHDGHQNAEETDQKTKQMIFECAQKSADGKEHDQSTGNDGTRIDSLMCVQRGQNQIDQTGQSIDEQDGRHDHDDPFQN